MVRFFGACFDSLSARAPNGEGADESPPKLLDVLPMDVRADKPGEFCDMWEDEPVCILCSTLERASALEVFEEACEKLLLNDCDPVM